MQVFSFKFFGFFKDTCFVEHLDDYFWNQNKLYTVITLTMIFDLKKNSSYPKVDYPKHILINTRPIIHAGFNDDARGGSPRNRIG